MNDAPTLLEDDRLCARILEGHRVQESWLELWNRHGAHCIRIALRITRSDDEARSAVNEAWARACEKLDDSIRSFVGWISVLTKNQALDLVRSRRRIRERERPLEGHESATLAASEDPERVAAAREARRILLRHDGIDGEERRLLALRYVSGLRLEEIGRMTGRTANSVSVVLHRARGKLRLSPKVQELLLLLLLSIASTLFQGGLS